MKKEHKHQCNNHIHTEDKQCHDFCKNHHMAEDDIKFVTIDKISKQTEDEYLFGFKLSVNHDPGQFFQLSLFGIGESAISICSYKKDYLEMSVRNVGNVTSHICNLKPGDSIAMRGPYGHGYEMKKFHKNNVIIIGGGSGAAPVRGIIEYIIQNRLEFKDVNVFFGFRTMHHMLFENEYKTWEKAGISVDIVLSDGPKHPRSKKNGLITDIIHSDATKSNDNKIVFICGPPPMINAVCKELLDKGFNKDQLYISEERQMKCAVGRCGHCMIEDKYCCTDGPVFRYDELEGYNG